MMIVMMMLVVVHWIVALMRHDALNVTLESVHLQKQRLLLFHSILVVLHDVLIIRIITILPPLLLAWLVNVKLNSRSFCLLDALTRLIPVSVRNARFGSGRRSTATATRIAGATRKVGAGLREGGGRGRLGDDFEIAFNIGKTARARHRARWRAD